MTDAARWRLMRQDDNGNVFEVGEYPDRTSAERARGALEAGGHKQRYWIEPVPAQPDQR
ncbi:SPOR domain-containing protein [Nitrogeniibacter mangrovi]|uniref:SPOR domain-containing protein n=1 Tax=Nitrogeniibacter mangrovi TaxID=2016596 RepID=A0A6C1B2H1_9RHOO|nr:SPOR domain-containing protein [Nitrogeniibacter mangrovi]QID17842.1 SPOR domain-containing protein [Nitrogeniibacter mangrovi]